MISKIVFLNLGVNPKIEFLQQLFEIFVYETKSNSDFTNRYQNVHVEEIQGPFEDRISVNLRNSTKTENFKNKRPFLYQTSFLKS